MQTGLNTADEKREARAELRRTRVSSRSSTEAVSALSRSGLTPGDGADRPSFLRRGHHVCASITKATIPTSSCARLDTLPNTLDHRRRRRRRRRGPTGPRKAPGGAPRSDWLCARGLWLQVHLPFE
jgi:hypothetical protein